MKKLILHIDESTFAKIVELAGGDTPFEIATCVSEALKARWLKRKGTDKTKP